MMILLVSIPSAVVVSGMSRGYNIVVLKVMDAAAAAACFHERNYLYKYSLG